MVQGWLQVPRLVSVPHWLSCTFPNPYDQLKTASSVCKMLSAFEANERRTVHQRRFCFLVVFVCIFVSFSSYKLTYSLTNVNRVTNTEQKMSSKQLPLKTPPSTVGSLFATATTPATSRTITATASSHHASRPADETNVQNGQLRFNQTVTRTSNSRKWLHRHRIFRRRRRIHSTISSTVRNTT